MSKLLGKAAVLGLTALLLASCTTTKKEQPKQPQVAPTTTTEALPPVKTPEQLAQEADVKLRQTRTIYFDFDVSAIKDSFRELLQAHGTFLAKNPSIQVRLEGYADERGTPEYNIALGERRAKAVAEIFRTLGVSDSQMEVISYGEEKPVDPGHNEAAWAKNRRVEIIYND